MDEKSVSMSAPSEHQSGSTGRVLDPESRARREFLKKVGQASVAVPAAALLLSVNVQSASATLRQYGGGGGGTHPDLGPYKPLEPHDHQHRYQYPRLRSWIRILLRWLG